MRERTLARARSPTRGRPVPDSPDPTEVLARPLLLRCGLELPNRLAKAAMTEGLADDDQQPTVLHQRLYRRWADGGAGLLVSGNAMVDARSLERARNVVLDAQVDPHALRDWAAACAPVPTLVQLSHAGRQTNRAVQWTPVSASAGDPVRVLGAFGRPRALSTAEVEDLRDRFVEAAVRVVGAGFAGVQVHAAHGYLLSQFLSPATNTRDDRYGGSAAGRARLLLEVVAATRAALPDHAAVSVKVNSNDFRRGGLDEAAATQVVRWLDESGVDLVELSGGTYERLAFLDPDRASAARDAYFLDFAAAVRREVEVPVMLTGGWADAAAMARAVDAGDVDVVGLGRPLAADPDLPRRLLAGTAAAAPRPARALPGALRDPSDVGWYRLQMELVARGRARIPSLPPLACALDYVVRDVATALRNRRRRTGRVARVEAARG